MKGARILLSILLLCLGLSPLAAQESEESMVVTLVKRISGGPVSVVLPFEKDVFEESFVTVSVKLYDSQIDKLVFYTSEGEKVEIKTDPKKDTYCKSFRFFFGENHIRVVAYKNGKKVDKKRVDFYVKSFLSKYYKIVPAGYKKEFFHNGKNEEACKKCHDMSVNETPGVAFEEISESNCFACHNVLLDRKFAHAPTVNFLCLPCHDGSVGEKNQADAHKSRFTYPDPIAPKCLKCHKKKRKLWYTKTYKHDPVGAGKCNKCHNPHSSDVNKNFLRKNAWGLCTSCHADKYDKRAYKALFVSRAKNGEELFKNLLKEGFSCVTCHDPHASDEKFLMKTEYKDLEGVCLDITKTGGRW